MEYRVRIVQDTDCESPRDTMDTVGIIYMRRRYSSIDKHAEDPVRFRCKACKEDTGTSDYYDPACDCEEPTEPYTEHPVCIPLSYDYSRLIAHINLDLRDPEPDGWLYVPADAVAKEWQGDVAKAEAYVRNELTEYNHWLAGNTWGYQVDKVSTCKSCGTERVEYVEHCYGFIGEFEDALVTMRESLEDQSLRHLMTEEAYYHG